MPEDNTNQPQRIELPEDLSAHNEHGGYLVTDEQIADLHQQAQAQFDAIYEGGAPDVAGLAEANHLVGVIEELRTEQGRREEERDEAHNQLAQLHARVHGDPEGSGAQEPPETDQQQDTTEVDPPSDQAGTAVEGEIVDDQPQPAMFSDTGQNRATVPVDRQRLTARGARSLNQHIRNMATTARRGSGGGFHPSIGRRPTVSLQQAAQFAPDVRPPDGGQQVNLLAAADIPDYRVGTPLSSVADVAAAMSARARSVPLGPTSGGVGVRYHVAYVDRQHRFRLGEKATPREINEVLVAATDPEVLVAAGGWCAPPTTSYDFYNIVCEDGLVDLPTVGVPRGSMQWPQSASFGDIMGLDDNPWTWTNQDDIDAATDPEVTKPCQRIPCPEMDEATLDCDGICLTVGNLMDFAWPELVENHTRLLMAAHTHYMNMRHIQAMVNGSVAVNVPSLGAGTVAPVLSALNLQAWDMRELFRMCTDDILEAVLPRWIVGMVQEDIALRQGISPDDAFAVALNSLANWLDARNIRAQLVSDWQIGGANQLGGPNPATAWPAQVQALIYPPGTWVLGQGLRLSLGIIRDSVLNQTNDHTAAWMEECYLMARIGHQSRVVTVPICPNGNTHAGSQIDCPEIES